jgi:hypothetical protein
MERPSDFPSMADFAERDRAIKAAALDGGSWLKQALAGLGALPAGTRGLAKRFSYMLTCAQSPLPEPPKPTVWGMVFRAALSGGLIEPTSTIWRTARGGLGMEYQRTARWQALPMYYYSAHSSRWCKHCQKRFTRPAPGSRYCTTKCATEARIVARRERAKQASLSRADARSGLQCEACGASLKAKRSTKRFCSDRCRNRGRAIKRKQSYAGAYP